MNPRQQQQQQQPSTTINNHSNVTSITNLINKYTGKLCFLVEIPIYLFFILFALFKYIQYN